MSKRTTRRIGYAIAIVINVAMLVIVNNILDWGWISWLTNDLEQVLPLINVSLIASLVANAAYIAHDGPGFKGLLELVLNTISLIVTIRLLRVFPFDFATSGWEALTRTILIVAIVGISIAIVVQLTKLARMATRVGEDGPR